MTGQIPKYGKHFRRESVAYLPGFASRVYVLKAFPWLFIRSDGTSERWKLYVGEPHDVAHPIGDTQPNMRSAMDKAIRIGESLKGE